MVRKEYFEQNKYDENYFKQMAPGNYDYFYKSRGTELLACRLDDLCKVKILPGMKALDIGCGRGELVMYLANKGVYAVGLDYAYEAIRKAKECLEFYNQDVKNRFMIVQACAESMPFGTMLFDRIMSWANVEHLYQWQWLECLKQSYSILKEDGVIVIGTHPNEWLQKYAYMATRNIRQVLQRKKLKSVKERQAEEYEAGHVNIKNPISLKKDLRSVGFYTNVYVVRRSNITNLSIINRTIIFVLESVPFAKWIFRDNIIVVGAKNKNTLKEFVKMPGKGIIGCR
ncbi:MAG: class I SAM-dependent methyltransferase [Candidatus Edwardsbacteria bacterium]|nr:class I SAM-dependent methyltransferase [Candidatus Edwardsbacteria bacterium]